MSGSAAAAPGETASGASVSHFVPDADYEDQLKFVSSGRRRQYGSDCKWFTDVLGPLEGFLHSNLGRPWDKVHSELRHGLDVRKVTGRHIFDHLEQMVETDCWIGPDRTVYERPRGWRVNGFYVHPRSGLLCFVPSPSARARKKERLLRQYIDEIRLDHSQSYRLLDGQWYLVEYECVEIARRESHLRWDVAERKQVRLTWGDHRVAIGKRAIEPRRSPLDSRTHRGMGEGSAPDVNKVRPWGRRGLLRL